MGEKSYSGLGFAERETAIGPHIRPPQRPRKRRTQTVRGNIHGACHDPSTRQSARL